MTRSSTADKCDGRKDHYNDNHAGDNANDTVIVIVGTTSDETTITL